MWKNVLIAGVLGAICLTPLQYSEANSWDYWLKGIQKMEKAQRTPAVHYETIYPDDQYHDGQLTYIGQQTDDKVEFYRYTLIVDHPMQIKLHFISHVQGQVYFKMIDADEDRIEPFTSSWWYYKDPFNKTITLPAGTYYFSIYKPRYTGDTKNSNTGYFRFKFTEIVK